MTTRELDAEQAEVSLASEAPLDPEALRRLVPDRVFDGGDLDCGSGLVLLIRDNMRQIEVGAVLELRSREPTVRDELPPWCRMVGHVYLGALEADASVRYFLRRSAAAAKEEAELESDKARAQAYEWRVRARSVGSLASKVYCRNFAFDVGQPASFKDKDVHASAVEFLLVSLAGAVSTAFATECGRDGLKIDDIEVTAKGRLHDVLAHLGVEEGDPSFAAIELKCFASTMDDDARVRAAWQRTLARSPLTTTLARATELTTKLAIV